MPNQHIVDLLSRQLGDGLTHHGDGKPFVIPLPTFRNNNMPPEMADHFAQEAGLPSSDVAKLTAEAIVNTIETTGDSEIISKAELAELRAAAGTAQQPDRYRQLRITCNACFNVVAGGLFDFADPANPKVNAKGLFDALAVLSPECPHQRIDGGGA